MFDKDLQEFLELEQMAMQDEMKVQELQLISFKQAVGADEQLLQKR